jgi:hypothetical protein
MQENRDVAGERDDLKNFAAPVALVTLALLVFIGLSILLWSPVP